MIRVGGIGKAVAVVVWKVSKLKFSVGGFLLDSMIMIISLEITRVTFHYWS